MLAKLFKKTSSGKGNIHPALARLKQIGTRSGLCTRIRTADGKEVCNEVGPVMFFYKGEHLFVRDGAFYMVPPSNFKDDDLPLLGRGEVLHFRMQHQSAPYSLDCTVVQRVRFSDRLKNTLDPQAPVGNKLMPLGNLHKNEHRSTLRFAHIRGADGPQVFPYFRFDLFVERVKLNGLAHKYLPEVISYPGDHTLPEGLQEDTSAEQLTVFFHNILRANPDHLREVHITRVVRDTRSGATVLQDLGTTCVLGLKGETKGTQIHLRNPQQGKQFVKKNPDRFHEGDVLLIRFLERSLLQGCDEHYQWSCRIHKCGLEMLTLRPKGVIQKQTGLPVVVRDFCVGGVGLQNSPILETYLLGEDAVPEDPEDLKARLLNTSVLLHFYPRLYFPNDVEAYRPQIPASFSILGDIVRGYVDTGKDEGRIVNLGVVFRHDPVDFDPQTFDVTAWEPLRGLRENQYFKEIHRALNALLAFLG